MANEATGRAFRGTPIPRRPAVRLMPVQPAAAAADRCGEQNHDKRRKKRTNKRLAAERAGERADKVGSRMDGRRLRSGASTRRIPATPLFQSSERASGRPSDRGLAGRELANGMFATRHAEQRRSTGETGGRRVVQEPNGIEGIFCKQQRALEKCIPR